MSVACSPAAQVGRSDVPFRRRKQRADPLGRAARVVGVLVSAAVLMADDEQGAAGSDPVREPGVERVLRDAGVGVEGRDELEWPLGFPEGEVGLDPADRMSGGGLGGGALDGVGRDVDRGDIPPVRGEPPGLGALPASGVEGGPGWKRGELDGKGRVYGRGLVGSAGLVPVVVPVVLVEVLAQFLSAFQQAGRS
jgi:hypothetical protein